MGKTYRKEKFSDNDDFKKPKRMKGRRKKEPEITSSLKNINAKFVEIKDINQN